MDVVGAIPLHRLPKKARMHVIQIMDIKQQISLSLCSKSLKEAVKSLTPKCFRFDVLSDEESITIKVVLESDRSHVILWVDNEWITRLDEETPVRVLILNSDAEIPENQGNDVMERDYIEYWNSPFKKMKEWIHHLSAIFNHKIDAVRCSGVWSDVELFNETFSGIEFDTLDTRFNQNDDFRYVFNSISPRKNLFMHTNPNQNFEQENVGILLMQNHDTIIIHDGFKLTFNHILQINSRYVIIVSAEVDEKFLNKFIEHWIAGSNPRMECIKIRFSKVFKNLDRTTVFRGVRHKILASGENEVTRTDGTKARIAVFEIHDFTNYSFFSLHVPF